MNRIPVNQKPFYGIDAPKELRQFVIIGFIGVGLGILAIILGNRMGLMILNYLAFPLFFMGLSFWITSGIMVWGSLARKFKVRDEVIAAIPWRGDETVLDVGCGHGLMLIAAAKQLDSGKAIGIDVWSRGDQTLNSPEAVARNAQMEGVADRIEIRSGDARALAIPDDSIDVALSSWVLHNIEDSKGREQAVREITRVLKPGGHVTLVDISYTQQYAEILKHCGFQEVHISRPSYLFVVPTHRVEAVKPLPVA